MKNIGFTGTRNGLTPMQLLKIAQLINHYQPESVGIGDCIEADKQFWELIQLANSNPDFPKIYTVGHPPLDPSLRAFCKYDETKTALPYLTRNENIVVESDLIIACPDTHKEKLRSGTWATIRMSRKLKKPTIIIYPNGIVEESNLGCCKTTGLPCHCKDKSWSWDDKDDI